MGGGREYTRESEAIGKDMHAAFGPHPPEEVKGGRGAMGAKLRVGVDEGIPGDDVSAGAHVLESRGGARQLVALGVHDHNAVAEEDVGPGA